MTTALVNARLKTMMRILTFGLVGLLCSSRASAGAILINGTCVLGNCSSPDTLGIGGVNSPYDTLTYAFANGDRYHVFVSSSAGHSAANALYFSGGFYGFYQGNDSNTLSGTDGLTIDFLQNFTGNSGLENFWDFLEGYYSGANAAQRSVGLQAFVDGNPLSIYGPFYPGPFQSPGIPTYFNFSSLGDPLLIDLRLTATFAAGSDVGASLVANTGVGVITPPPPVPEPGSLSLLGAGLLSVGYIVRRRRTLRR